MKSGNNTCTFCESNKRALHSRCCGNCKTSSPENVRVVGDPLDSHLRVEFPLDLITLEGENTIISVDLS